MIKLHWNKNWFLLNPVAINTIYPTNYGSHIKICTHDLVSSVIDCDETPDEVLKLFEDWRASNATD